jgi:hypothetical protein
MHITKSFIRQIAAELFPDLRLQVSFGGEGPPAGFAGELVQSLGIAMAIKAHGDILRYHADPQYLGVTQRFAIGAEIHHVLWCNPQRLGSYQGGDAYLPLYILMHELAHGGIDRLSGAEKKIEEAFPGHHLIKGTHKKLAELDRRLGDLGDALLQAADDNRDADPAQSQEFDRLREENQRLMAAIKHPVNTSIDAFINGTIIDFIAGKGRRIEAHDLDLFNEGVCDLFACVETARRMGTPVTDMLNRRADTVRAQTYTMLGRIDIRQPSPQADILLEHYTAGTLAAAARDGGWHEGRQGYALLEACVAVAAAHFTPVDELRGTFAEAQRRGFMACGASDDDRRRATAKILMTEAADSPLYTLAEHAMRLMNSEKTGPVRTVVQGFARRYIAPFLRRIL